MSIRSRFNQFRDRVARPATEDASDTEADGSPAASPRLVVGLGNPGAGYARTRHNVGVWCVTLLAERHGGRLERQGRVDSAEIEVGGRRLAVARPRTFYNEAGPAIAAELKRLRLKPADLLVIYDELDLPVGKVRLRLQGSHGGNNGMKSIIGALGSNAFPRIRIGIDRPYDAGAPVREPDRIADWVLSPPTPDDRERLEGAVAAVADAVELAVREDIQAAMNRVNRAG